MYLQGQPGRRGEHGYAMATLLVALAVMAVLMSAALPAWRHQAKREKEAELAFRGEQYVRAIQLWERKMGPGSRPPSFDILVQQKYLRKKYMDPMSADGEFQPLFAGLNQAPGGGRGRGAAPTPPAGRGNPAGALAGGIIGVRSTSTEASIRIYKGATRYNEWQFIHAGAATTPGGRGGSPVPGGRGVQPMPGGPGRGRGTGPDGRGIGPGGRGFGPGIPGLPGRGRGQ